MTSPDSHPLTTALTWLGVGLIGFYIYQKLGVATIPSVIGQPAPVTASSATFPPQAAPTGYYWAPQQNGGYALAPLSYASSYAPQQNAIYSLPSAGYSPAISPGLFTGAGQAIGNLFSSLFGTASSSPTFSGANDNALATQFGLSFLSNPVSIDSTPAYYSSMDLPASALTTDLPAIAPIADFNLQSDPSLDAPLPDYSGGAGLLDIPGATAAYADNIPTTVF